MERVKLVILDGDHFMGNSLAEVLNMHEFDAVAVQKWTDGRTIMKEGAVDIVLIDLNHPQVNEPGAMDKIRTDCNGSAVILLTAPSTLELAVEAARTWAYAYLVKPYAFDQLFLLIRRAAEKQEAAAKMLRLQDELTRERELVRQREEAARATRSDFLSRIKKELSTRLNIITGCSVILMNDCSKDLTEKQKELITHILDSGRMLQQRVSYTHEFLEEDWSASTKSLRSDALSGERGQNSRHDDRDEKNPDH